jgi:hypothetical protein
LKGDGVEKLSSKFTFFNLLDSLQTSEVVGFLGWEKRTVGCGGDKSDEDNDVQTGFHFKIYF